MAHDARGLLAGLRLPARLHAQVWGSLDPAPVASDAPAALLHNAPPPRSSQARESTNSVCLTLPMPPGPGFPGLAAAPALAAAGARAGGGALERPTVEEEEEGPEGGSGASSETEAADPRPRSSTAGTASTAAAAAAAGDGKRVRERSGTAGGVPLAWRAAGRTATRSPRVSMVSIGAATGHCLPSGSRRGSSASFRLPDGLSRPKP